MTFNRQIDNVDDFIIELQAVIKRPLGTSLTLKETVTSLQHINEYEDVGAFIRHTFYLPEDANGQHIELGEVDVVNMLIIVTSGKVLVELGDADGIGFGEGFFGEGGFGGEGQMALGGIINGLCVVEGSYKDLYFSNLISDTVKIDMFAIKYSKE